MEYDREAMDDWLTLHVPITDRYSKFLWPGRPEFDYQAMAEQIRGLRDDYGGREFVWEGKARPPDFFWAGTGVYLMSERAWDALQEAEIRGLDFAPATVSHPEDGVLDYTLLVVPTELESICFKRVEPFVANTYRCSEPQLRGLDPAVSDVFITPRQVSLEDIFVHRRFVDVAKRKKLTNIDFFPASELTADLLDPDRVLCR